jgi:hypothetical protein
MADYSKAILSCGHCGNISHMSIVGSISDTQSESDEEGGYYREWGTTYEVLDCPACHKKNIFTYPWSDFWDDEDEVVPEILYPVDQGAPIGLPNSISKTFMAAEKIKRIDVNAYAILMRRLLEQVCIDRNAKRGTLAEMLSDLAGKKEIPDKLVNVAKGLRNFGNIGAHAGDAELSEKEIPIVHALTKAILEYIYSAPHLATIAEQKLAAIKSKGKQ